MKMLFSIYDNAVKAYNTPFAVQTQTQALRAFESTVLDPQSNINRFPEDYHLYNVGEFYEESGVIVSFDSPIHVSKALDFVDPTSKERQLDVEEYPGVNHEKNT